MTEKKVRNNSILRVTLGLQMQCWGTMLDYYVLGHEIQKRQQSIKKSSMKSHQHEQG